jgi:acetyl-CoA acetyltransferase
VHYRLEAAGFCPECEAFPLIQDGWIALNGDLPVNTFGGCLSEGRLHGMGHLTEAVYQATERAGPRQVEGAKSAIARDGPPLFRGSGVLFTSDA